MGNKHAINVDSQTQEEDEAYLKFIREKSKKDEERHKIVSNQRGTAFNRLTEFDKRNKELPIVLNSARQSQKIFNNT
jgi:hypothetical protein